MHILEKVLLVFKDEFVSFQCADAEEEVFQKLEVHIFQVELFWRKVQWVQYRLHLLKPELCNNSDIKITSVQTLISTVLQVPRDLVQYEFILEPPECLPGFGMMALHVVENIRVYGSEDLIRIPHHQHDLFHGITGRICHGFHLMEVLADTGTDQLHHDRVFIGELAVNSFFGHAQVSGQVVHGDAFDPVADKKLLGSC